MILLVWAPGIYDATVVTGCSRPETAGQAHCSLKVISKTMLTITHSAIEALAQAGAANHLEHFPKLRNEHLDDRDMMELASMDQKLVKRDINEQC
ncbi:hypothetical protein RugamoR1_57550 [Rugamonas sp. R1(2021)]